MVCESHSHRCMYDVLKYCWSFESYLVINEVLWAVFCNLPPSHKVSRLRPLTKVFILHDIFPMKLMFDNQVVQICNLCTLVWTVFYYYIVFLYWWRLLSQVLDQCPFHNICFVKADVFLPLIVHIHLWRIQSIHMKKMVYFPSVR